VTPCSLAERYRHFGWICCIYLQHRRYHEDESCRFPLKLLHYSNRLYGTASHKIVLFILTTAITSNLIYKHIIKVKVAGSLNKKPVKGYFITEDRVDKTEAPSEHSPWRSLRCLAQESGISKSSTAKVMKLFKLWPHKTTVNCALQPHDLTSKVNIDN
jgi:hypothetical protein